MEDNWPGNNIPQANGAAANAPDEDEDDFGEFGGFEAADPVAPNVAQPGNQAEAGSSPWAVYASGGGAFRQPDLLCAQNAFPQYLDPSGISGEDNSASPAEEDGHHIPFQVNNLDHNASAAEQARIAENVLDGTLNASARNLSSPEVTHSPPSPAPLPDLGLGGSGLPLRREPSSNMPEGAGLHVGQEAQLEPSEEDAPEAEQAVAQAAAAVQSPPNRVEPDMQPVVEENVGLKRDLEALNSLNSQLESDLSRTRTELEEHRTRLANIQEEHTRDMDSVRQAGHDAIAVVVDEYKELSKTAVLEQQERSLQHLKAVLKEQTECFQQMLEDQAAELKRQHEAEVSQKEEDLKAATASALKDQEEKFDAFLAEEREKHITQIREAVEAERESNRRLMESAIAEEQTKAAAKLEKEKEKFGEVAQEVKATCTEEVKAVVEDERKKSQDLLAAAVEEEREKSRENARETQRQAHEELQSHLQEQRQRDAVLRQRHMTSLDLFLGSARQQLQLLIDSDKELCAKPEAKKDGDKNS